MKFMAFMADRVVTYAQGACDLLKTGVVRARYCDVIHNTQYVDRLPWNAQERIRSRKVIYVGALTERKKLSLLLKATHKLLSDGCRIEVEIYGDGPIRSDLIKEVIDLGVCDAVQVHPAVYDRQDLNKIFSSARLACSPGQAGLFVLQSFAYGLPFVTSERAVSGGEIENITPGVTGLFFNDTTADLSEKLKILLENDEYALALSKEAYNKYWRERRMDQMTDRFVRAVLATVTGRPD